MAVSIKEVEHIAGLSMLELSDEEKKTMSYELTSIIDWIGQLNELDTSKVIATSTIMKFGHPLRKDKAVKSGKEKQILANTPVREYDFIKVKKVIDDE